MKKTSITEKLERDVSLERLAQARGVQLRNDGTNLVGRCPFHPKGKVTVTIIPRENTWTCPRCKIESGTVIDWTMKAEGVSRKHAVELLRGDHSVEGDAGKTVKRSTVQKLPGVLDHDAGDDVLMAQVVGYYHETLKNNVQAMELMAAQGFTAELIDTFKIGFSDRTLGYRMPDRYRKDGAAIRARLQKLGILRDSGHEHFRGCITVPLFDAQGRIAWIYGRRISIDPKRTESPDVHLPGEPRGVFNVAAFQASKEIILTASILDAMAIWCSGLRHVTAAVGDHFEAFRTYKIEKVVIAFPRAEDGDDAAKKLSIELAQMGIETFRVHLPVGLTGVEYLRQASPEELHHLIRKAEWMATGNKERPVTASPAPEHSAFPVIDPHQATVPVEPTRKTKDGNGEIILQVGDRRWRVRGFEKNSTFETMKVNLFVSRDGAEHHPLLGFHVDNVELYSSRQRSLFSEQAADELGVEAALVKQDLGQVLLHLEGLQERAAQEATKPSKEAPEMLPGDRDAALELLRDPALLDRIVADFEKIGIVGERDNLLVGYLAATSRKLTRPLAVVLQSSSAAGKSSVMEAVLSFIPEEERHGFSAMTGQSLYYMGADELKHRVLSIAEEKGAERASYALKVLQSEGALTIASTGKDPGTGRMVSHEYRVEGPVAIMMTTTAIDLDEELLNRCIVLSVDESPDQTAKIQERQRAEMTLEGFLVRDDRLRIEQLHRNAQRLLRPVRVVNPLASGMIFLDHRVRARRDHRKLLGLVEAVTLLHQHQRQVKVVEHHGKVEFIEATEKDIEIAQVIMKKMTGANVDDLPPGTRTVLGLLSKMRAEASSARRHRFTRREVRARFGLGSTQTKIHLQRLVEAEYVIVHPAPHGRGVVYELAFGGYDDERSGNGRPMVGGRSGGGRAMVGSTIQHQESSNSHFEPEMEKTSRSRSAEDPTVAVDPGRP